MRYNLATSSNVEDTLVYDPGHESQTGGVHELQIFQWESDCHVANLHLIFFNSFSQKRKKIQKKKGRKEGGSGVRRKGKETIF